MINSKVIKQAVQQNSEERLFKLLESIDWKLWEMYNMMKDHPSVKETLKKSATKKPSNKTTVE